MIHINFQLKDEHSTSTNTLNRTFHLILSFWIVVSLICSMLVAPPPPFLIYTKPNEYLICIKHAIILGLPARTSLLQSTERNKMKQLKLLDWQWRTCTYVPQCQYHPTRDVALEISSLSLCFTQFEYQCVCVCVCACVRVYHIRPMQY